MATSIANLSVRISGNSAGLRGATDDSRKSLTSLQKAANTSLAFVEKSFIAAGVAALATAAAIGKLAKTGFQSIDSVSDLSKRIGIGVQALSELQHAAVMADVEIDSLTTGLQKMLVNVQKGASGSSEAAKVFTDIGLNAAQLKSMRPEQAFAQIADAIASIEDPYRRAKAAQDIFGKGGQALIPLLSQGSANLASMAEQARGLGNSVTAIESEKVDALDDAFKKSKAAVVGLSQAVIVALAPSLNKILNDVTSFVASSGGLKSVAAPAIDAVNGALARVGSGWNAVKAAAGAARSAAEAFGFSSLASLVKTTAAIGALIVVGARVAGMIKATSIAWVALRASIGTSIVALRAWGMAASSSFAAASIMQGRFIAGMRLLGATTLAVGKIMKSAIMFGIGIAAVVAVTAFAQVVGRQITQNEKWSASALHVARSWGLFRDATTNYGLALEELGKTSNEVRIIQEKLAAAKSMEAKIDLTKDLVDQLQKQLDTQKQLQKLQIESGQDAGITDTTIEAVRQKLTAAEKELAKLNEARSGVSAPSSEMPEMPDDTQAVNEMADAVRALDAAQADAATGTRNFSQEMQDARAAWNAGTLSSADFVAAITSIRQAIDAANAGEMQKLNEAIAETKKEIDSLNMSPIDIKIADLTSGGTDELKKQAEEYRRILEELDTAKLGQRLRESLVTPIDEAQQQFEEIQRAAEAGVITADEHAQLLANLQDQVGGVELTGPSDQFGTAAQSGSVESNRLDAMFRNQQARTKDKKDYTQDIDKKAQKQIELLGDIAKAIGESQVTEVNI